MTWGVLYNEKTFVLHLYHYLQKDQEMSLHARLLITRADSLLTSQPRATAASQRRIWVTLHLMCLSPLNKSANTLL